MATCKKCGHSCHCSLDKREHKIIVDCDCDNCECLQDQKDRANDLTYESNGGLVIDDTNECESCQ